MYAEFLNSSSVLKGIPIDAATDERMKTAASSEASSSYILGFQDCTHVVKKALEAGGLKDGESTGMGITRNDTGEEYKSGNWMPATKQAEIEKRNPGVGIDSRLKPIPVNFPEKASPIIPPSRIDNLRPNPVVRIQ